jgi:hypothetical protein
MYVVHAWRRCVFPCDLKREMVWTGNIDNWEFLMEEGRVPLFDIDPVITFFNAFIV